MTVKQQHGEMILLNYLRSSSNSALKKCREGRKAKAVVGHKIRHRARDSVKCCFCGRGGKGQMIKLRVFKKVVLLFLFIYLCF